MTKYQIVRADLERARDRLDSTDTFDLDVQVMLDAVIETVLTLECAKRPCEIIPFPGASRPPSLDG